MDSLDYYYNSNTNQLNYVDDAVDGTYYSDDIDDESSNNYLYDGTGNLVHDVSQEIDTIKWTVYGKISDVIRTSTSTKADLHFDYDAMGNRICKIVKPRNGSGIETQDNWTYTYYERDAQGNVLSTYSRAFPYNGMSYSEVYDLKENDLYGSSRVGLRSADEQQVSLTLAISGFNSDGTLNIISMGVPDATTAPDSIFVHEVGRKSYELTNHLGNVLVTVSDMRTANHASSTITGWNAVVNSATDYYAFGSPMEGRSYSSGNYKFGFNGQEKDDEVTGSGDDYFFKYRMEDARLGRFMSIDPLARKFAGNSPYAFAQNRVIDGRELEGLEVVLLGFQGSGNVVLGLGAGGGILFAPDGVYAYMAMSGSLATNISTFDGISVTYYGDMKKASDAAGLGWSIGLGGGELLGFEANYTTSNGYDGLNIVIGGTAGALVAQAQGAVSKTKIFPLSKTAKDALKSVLTDSQSKLKSGLDDINKNVNKLQSQNDALSQQNADLKQQLKSATGEQKDAILAKIDKNNQTYWNNYDEIGTEKKVADALNKSSQTIDNYIKKLDTK